MTKLGLLISDFYFVAVFVLIFHCFSAYCLVINDFDIISSG